jgi:hypothetical protein
VNDLRPIETSETPVAVREEPQSMLALIAKALHDPAFDISRLETLLRFQRELMADSAKTQFNEAFARLQPQLPRVKKNGEVWYPVEKNNPDGPQYRAFKYAKWEDIDEGIRPLLNTEGFSLSFDTQSHPSGGYLIIGKLSHSAGHEKTATFGPVPLDTSGGKNNLQGAASSLSYGKRHTGSMLLNLVFEGEDDDGNGGMITEEQAKEIVDLMRQAGAGPKFLKYVKAQSVDDMGSLEAAVATIQSRNYRAAVSTLKERIAKGKRSDNP